MSSRREEYSRATREALVAAGRDAFERVGYQSAGIEAISRAARVTRGAFYHHFDDKKALFDAVVVAMQDDASQRIAERARTEDDVWERLTVGIDAYLDLCVEPAYARIVIEESPVVLGRRRHQEIEDTYPLALLVSTLTALQHRGELDVDDVDHFSAMLDAMICRTALLMPTADDPGTLRHNCQATIAGLLRTVRRGGEEHHAGDRLPTRS